MVRLAKTAGIAPVLPVRPSPGHLIRSMRVIFADDNVIARTLLGAVLEDLGHDAAIFEDGQSAWEAYQANPAPLVILDIKMPGIDGLETCRRIRASESGRTTFILIVTAFDGPGDLKAVLDAGADDYVAKPSSPKQLRARIEIAERRVGQAAALRAAEVDLAQARWLAGIGETAIALEREMTGPLDTILDRARTLLEDAKFTDDQLQQLRVIKEQGTRLAGVIGRAVALQSPQSVEYLGGSKMIDLSGEYRAATPATPRKDTEPPSRNDRTDAG
jgi:DNA-binding response OmpR family regulator